MSSISRARRQAYRAARIAGDIEAARRGPASLLRRIARRAIYRQAGRAAREVSRAVRVDRP